MSTTSRDRLEPGRHGKSRLLDRARRTLVAASFWCAVVFPAAYLPLVVTGVTSTRKLILVLTLVVLHVFTLVCGHEYTDEHNTE